MLTNEMSDTQKLFEDGGLNQQGGEGQVDPVSGNDVPAGAMQEEVRDDIDAKLSEGEFVFPADVVRYFGLAKLMQMRDQAKKGLQRMEDIGQMGNASEVENPEALHGEDTASMDEDASFSSAVDQAMSEVKMASGGVVSLADGGSPSIADTAGGTGAPLPKFQMKKYTNAAGQTLYIPFMGTEPLLTVPEGYNEGAATPTETTDTVQPTAGVVKKVEGDTGTADVPSTSASDFGITPVGEATSVGTSTGTSVTGPAQQGLNALTSITNNPVMSALGIAIPGYGLITSAAHYGLSTAALSEQSATQDVMDQFSNWGVPFSIDSNGVVSSNSVNDIAFMSTDIADYGPTTTQEAINADFFDSISGIEATATGPGQASDASVTGANSEASHAADGNDPGATGPGAASDASVSGANSESSHSADGNDSGASGGGGSSGGCFITTAAVEHNNEKDEGELLTTLRKFRDEIMRKDKSKAEDVKWYYKNAPAIVKGLNKLDNSKTVYNRIYQQYLRPAAKAINAGENDKAFTLYKNLIKYSADKAGVKEASLEKQLDKKKGIASKK